MFDNGTMYFHFYLTDRSIINDYETMPCPNHCGAGMELRRLQRCDCGAGYTSCGTAIMPGENHQHRLGKQLIRCNHAVLLP